MDQSVDLTVTFHVVQGSSSLAEYMVVLLLPMIERALYGHSIEGSNQLADFFEVSLAGSGLYSRGL